MNAIKYTCPRCGVHTCSLPCVKKHKAWAQCSGVRNPAEYRKRADLATPSSIDKDFNFITNVERSVARADQGVSDRGITLAPARQLRGCDNRPKWEIEADQRQITIVKAPKGLSRSKQTKTHWNTQHKCITWTIEWVCTDNERVLAQCMEIKTVGEAFLQTVGKKAIKRKRRLSKETGPPNQKVQKISPSSPSSKNQENNRTKDEDSSNAPIDAPAVSEQLLTDLYFYLHKANTPSSFKCLIPLSGEQPLREILDGRTLLEFPTIYVKFEAPEQLSLPFISEVEYQQKHGTDAPNNIVERLEEGELEELDTLTIPASVDTKKVLEVLAQDLAG